MKNCKCGTCDAGGRLRHLLILGIVIVSFLGAPFVQASNPIVQTFYVPVTEPEYRIYAHAQTDPNDESRVVRSVISITATFDGTIIYYDQWEDGYEDDLTNPTQSTTQIWGDGNASNGAPPGCNSDACDVINAGTVITLQQDVPVIDTGAAVTSGIRDQGDLYYDGRDKFSATQQLVVTRAIWPVGSPGAIGAMLAGSVEVLETGKWGSYFEMPVGINMGVASFNWTAVSIMAQKDGTVVHVHDGVSGLDITRTLNQGETLFVEDLNVGATITSTGSNVQVDMLTASPGSNYEGRLYTLVPIANLGKTYYCPVPTTRETGGTLVPNTVRFYNPNDHLITLTINYSGGSTSLNVPLKGTASYPMPEATTGARFSSTLGDPFYALAQIDNGTVHNWGFTLIPLESLTPSAVVGWSPGTTDKQRDASPVWVTPVANTTIYVDYDGNPNTGTQSNCGSPTIRCDQIITATALQSIQLFSPGPAGSYDHTGWRIYTADNTRLAVAWGQDGHSSSSGQLTEFDLGTTVLPYPSLVAYKSAALMGDYNNNGELDPGELLLYTIRIHNSGIVPITDINLLDTLDPDVTYVADTTARGSTPNTDTPIPDDASPGTRFPLDGGGYNIVISPAQLIPGQDIYVTFQATANNPFPPNKFEIINNAKVSSISEIFLNSQVSAVLQGTLQTNKTSSISPNKVKPGDTIEYTVTVTNTSGTPQTGITLSDPLPTGTHYMASTTTATGPRQKFVKDRFDKLLYTNNDGPETWKTAWTENDSGGGGSTGGNVQVINGELRLTAAGSYASRSVDLSEFAGGYAILRFDYRTSPFFPAMGEVVAEISSNGSAFSQLYDFVNIPGVNSGTKIFDLSNSISADTTARFRVVSLPTTLAFTSGGSYVVKVGDVIRGHTSGATATVSAVSVTSGSWATGDAAGNLYLVNQSGTFQSENLDVGANLNVATISGNSVTHYFYVDDVEIRAVGAAKAVSDDLSSNNYSGGTGVWSGPWIENDASGGSQDPAAGKVQVNGGRLRLTGPPVGSGNPTEPHVRRSADFSGHVFGLLSFDFQIVAVTSSDIATVEVLSKDGTTYVPLETFIGVSSGSRTYDITNYLHSNTTVRFRITNGYAGAGQYLYIDNVRISAGRQLVVTKDNIKPGGTYPDLADGVPANIVLPADGFALAPGDTITARFRVIADNPLNVTRVVNTATATSQEKAPPSASTTIDPVSTGGTIGDLVWLDTIVNGTYDYGEPGIYNVRVWLDTNNNNVFDSGVDLETRTGTDGKYIFEGLLPGTYKVFVDETTIPSGLARTTGTVNPSSPITITGEEKFLNIDFGYKTANSGVAIIGDYVWSDANNNGIQDPGEVGIGGVTMQLVTSPGGVVLQTTPTNAFGIYLFTNVSPGTYVVKSDTLGILTGYTPTSGPQSIGKKDSDPLTVTGGNSYIMMDFGFYNPSLFSISDRLWFDSNNNGLLDPGEPGIKDVTLTLLDSGGQVKAATLSDVNGNFSFTGVPNGSYTIRIEDATGKLIGFAGTTAAARNDRLSVTVAGGNVSGVDFGYNAPGRIGDTVWRDLNSNRVRDTGEPGIQGVTVQLYKDTNGDGVFDPASDQLVTTTTTDSDGNYMFQVSGAGRFFVSIDNSQPALSGLVLTTRDDEPYQGAQIQVDFYDLNTSYLAADFGYNAPGSSSILGLIWNDLNSDRGQDTGEQGISGVTVRLYRDANGNNAFDAATDTLVATTTTDSAGSYSFQVSQTGMYFVSVDDTQSPLIFKTLTTTDDWPLVPGAQRTVSVTQMNASYPNIDFGFVTLNSDLTVTKTAVPSGNVKPGDTITYTIAITNGSLTTTQTGIAVNDPLPTYTAYVSGSASATGYTYGTANASSTADADTHIRQTNPTNSYGAADPLSIRYVAPGNTDERRALVHFPLPVLPAWSTVNSATMQFNVSTANANISAINLYQLTRSWVEGTTASPCTNGATWATYNCANNWGTAGGDYDSGTLIGSFSPATTGNKTVSSTELSSLVINWYGATPNNGVILIATSANANSQTAAVRPRENGTAGNRPQITVNYTYPSATTKAPTVDYPSGSTLVSSSDGFILAPGQAMTVTYRVTVSSSLPPGVTQILNEATVSSDQSGPRKASVANGVTYTADLQITKIIKSIDSPCNPGSCNVTFTVRATNVGNSSETNVQVKDQLPADLTWISDTGGGSYNHSTGIWTVPGSIGIGGSASLDITARVTGNSSSITNCASLNRVSSPLSPNPDDTNTSNDSSCVSITPTYVTLSDFRAYEDKGRMVVEWTTSAENGTAGFYLLRKDASPGEYQLLNRRLLPALLSSPQGGTYSLIDNGASPNRSYTYVLVEVEGKGKKNVYGPFTVRPGEDGAVENPGLTRTIDPDLLLRPVNGITTAPSGKVTQYVNKDGVHVITNINLSNPGGLPAGRDLFSNYTKKAKEPSRSSVAPIKVSKKPPVNPGMVKIPITKDGLYFLSASDISAAMGLPEKTIRKYLRGKKISLSNQGQSVAYTTDTDYSGILFYGQGLNTIYTNTNIYWLSPGRGLKMEEGKKRRGPIPDSGNPAFTDTVHAENDRIIVPALFNDPEADYWFWDFIVSGDDASDDGVDDSVKSFTIPAEGAEKVSSTATLSVNLHGLTSTDANPDHHVMIYLNDTFIGEDEWDGTEPHKVILPFNQELLRDANKIEVKGVLNRGVPYSIFYINSFDLTYERLYRAADNVLICRGGENPVVTVTGFTGPDILLFDITDSTKPKVIHSRTITSTEGTYSVSFNPASPEARYLAVLRGSVTDVTEAWSRRLAGLTNESNQADYLIITIPELEAASKSLAGYRERKGLTPKIVFLEDIMNEFNYGIYDPRAIRDFLSYAYHHWIKPPKYVVLAGNGTFDYKNHLGQGDNLIPTLMANTPMGLYASDNLFADVDGDHVPRMAVGRLPVLTAEELQNIVDKTSSYETGMGNHVLLLADDPDDGGNFPEDSDTVAALLPPPYTVEKIYLSQHPVEEARSMLLDRINDGAVFLNYIGHGRPDGLASEGLLTTENVNSMNNARGLHVMTAMTCLAGQFAIPGYDSLSESLVLKKDGGSAAVWAPTGYSFNSLAMILDEEFIRAAFDSPKPVLGDAILKAFKGYSMIGGETFMIDIYTLLGDPALQLR